MSNYFKPSGIYKSTKTNREFVCVGAPFLADDGVLYVPVFPVAEYEKYIQEDYYGKQLYSPWHMPASQLTYTGSVIGRIKY